MPRLMLLLIAAAVVIVAFFAFPEGEEQLPTRKVASADLVNTISAGEKVDMDQHLSPSTWTVVVFQADW